MRCRICKKEDFAVGKCRAEGIIEGRAEGEAKGLINAAKELGASYEKTLDMVVDKLHISHEDGKKYMDMYWNA